MTLKCLAKDRNNENCRNNQLDTSNFCKFHQYMNDYSEKMLNELTICSGCKKMYYLPDSKQCKKCKERGETCRIKHKNEKILCKKNECNFEKSTDNDYCGKHQKEYFREETELIGKKVCVNYIRGCYTQMNKSDTFSKCLKCREKERVGYKRKNNVVNDNLDELEKELEFFENKSTKNNIFIMDNKNNKDIKTKNDDLDELEKELEFFKKSKKNNIVIVDDKNNKDFNMKLGIDKNKKIFIVNDTVNDNLDKLGKELENFENKATKNNIVVVDDENNKEITYSSDISFQCVLNTQIHSLPEHYFIPEYMTDTTKLILEIIDNFETLNIDFQYAEEFMECDYKINKIFRYMDAVKKDGIYIFDNITECTNPKCKKNMPEHCFIDKFSRKVNKCIVCRIHGRIKDNREQRKKSKEEWKEENYDKCAMYWQNFRGRKIEELGVDKYLENNAKTMEKWRNKNPDKVKIANEKKKENVDTHYKNYIRDANMKNLKFDLSFDDFIEIVKQVCYYCGKLQEKGLNGIDKMDCNGGYVKENCASCCEMCNIMKGTLSVNVFLKRIEHILTYQGYIEGKLYPECFANHMSSNYNHYKKRAEKKQLDFEISEDDFYSLIIKKCYICGKKPEEEHINGIDRIDNDKGYVYNNIEACCGECNYMKNKFSLQDFFDKLRKIKKHKLIDFKIVNSEFRYQHKIKQIKYLDKQKKINDTEELKKNIREKQRINKQKYREKIKNNKIDVIDENKTIIDNNLKITHLNKKTPDQLKEEARIRKQKQRERLKEKYGDEEYKKKRALELAEYRKKKREEK